MIRVLISDDESPARGRVASFLAEYPEMEVIGEAESGEETIQLAERLRPDVIFLDIQMPKGDGFEVISRLQYSPVIVFTTAYDEYAIEAFNVHALDYLLKPFSKERFGRSVELLKKNLKDPHDYQRKLSDAVEQLESQRDHLRWVSVGKDYSYSLVSVGQIEWIKTSGRLVFIHAQGQDYQTDTTLDQFERRLDPRSFMRVHRTAIVNLEKIANVTKWGPGNLAVVMSGGTSIQVSRKRTRDFKARIGLII